ncbi:hypothetical protein EYF80_038996 [Liparis tanakae]|uniref:Uncharacterized protein n=1 Tax=Liparis tanakae TaxID=230148 RepID=A0A4Z2GDI5_9TELE|nr:hypothetical protein EYF80_038996 [Liparis tanakae]
MDWVVLGRTGSYWVVLGPTGSYWRHLLRHVKPEGRRGRANVVLGRGRRRGGQRGHGTGRCRVDGGVHLVEETEMAAASVSAFVVKRRHEGSFMTSSTC